MRTHHLFLGALLGQCVSLVIPSYANMGRDPADGDGPAHVLYGYSYCVNGALDLCFHYVVCAVMS